MTPSKFWFALGVSVSLHAAVGTALSLEPRCASNGHLPAVVDLASDAPGTTAALGGAPIPIETLVAAPNEPSAATDVRGLGSRAVPGQWSSPREPDKIQNSARGPRGARAGEPDTEPSRPGSERRGVASSDRGNPAPGLRNEQNAASEPKDHRGTGRSADEAATIGADVVPSSTDLHGSVTTERPSLAAMPHSMAARSGGVDRASLHEAMAASTSANHGNTTFTPPVIRVDPQEKNLDRAFARAFAWAFAVDRSFFATVPTGQARFAITLAEDGRIAAVEWGDDRAPPRLRELVERMVKLLSVNRFNPPAPVGESRARRTFQLVVAESRVSAPPDAPASGKPGDIWMLAAGDTPSPGRPSHPSVADVTGHQIHGNLAIVSAL